MGAGFSGLLKFLFMADKGFELQILRALEALEGSVKKLDRSVVVLNQNVASPIPDIEDQATGFTYTLTGIVVAVVNHVASFDMPVPPSGKALFVKSLCMSAFARDAVGGGLRQMAGAYAGFVNNSDGQWPFGIKLNILGSPAPDNGAGLGYDPVVDSALRVATWNLDFGQGGLRFRPGNSGAAVMWRLQVGMSVSMNAALIATDQNVFSANLRYCYK